MCTDPRLKRVTSHPTDSVKNCLFGFYGAGVGVVVAAGVVSG